MFVETIDGYASRITLAVVTITTGAVMVFASADPSLDYSEKLKTEPPCGFAAA